MDSKGVTSVHVDPDELLPEADYGRLPFDMFMLEKWDNESPDNDAMQRQFLSDYYVQLGSIVRKRYESSASARVNLTRPTEAQIVRILAPLQTNRERNLSSRTRKVPTAWLRTCYEPDTDAAHRALLAEVGHQGLLARLGSEEAILDNAVLYDFDQAGVSGWESKARANERHRGGGSGEGWQQVFQRLPALLAGQLDRNDIQRAKRDAVQDAQYEVDVYGEDCDSLGSSAAPDWAEVLALSTIGFFLLADRTSLTQKNGGVRLVWYDDCGRCVKHTRLPAAEVLDVFVAHRNGRLYDVDTKIWQEAETGWAYLRGGPCGPPLNADAQEFWESDEDAEIY